MGSKRLKNLSKEAREWLEASSYERYPFPEQELFIDTARHLFPTIRDRIKRIIKK